MPKRIATIRRTRSEVPAAKVLHLACHGRIDAGRPALSHLALAVPDLATRQYDGYLTVAELAGLSLQADLVVLSACESNAGEIHAYEGITGLSRAALLAGANAVLPTL